MAERFIKYGNRTLPMPDDLKLDDAKAIMARHFPELAENPRIETKKEGETTTYIFSKQAGRKGSTSHVQVAKRLARLKPWAVVPETLVDFVVGASSHVNVTAEDILKREITMVHQTREALFQLAPAFNPEAAELLL